MKRQAAPVPHGKEGSNEELVTMTKSELEELKEQIRADFKAQLAVFKDELLQGEKGQHSRGRGGRRKSQATFTSDSAFHHISHTHLPSPSSPIPFISIPKGTGRAEVHRGMKTPCDGDGGWWRWCRIMCNPLRVWVSFLVCVLFMCVSLWRRRANEPS